MDGTRNRWNRRLATFLVAGTACAVEAVGPCSAQERSGARTNQHQIFLLAGSPVLMWVDARGDAEVEVYVRDVSRGDPGGRGVLGKFMPWNPARTGHHTIVVVCPDRYTLTVCQGRCERFEGNRDSVSASAR